MNRARAMRLCDDDGHEYDAAFSDIDYRVSECRYTSKYIYIIVSQCLIHRDGDIDVLTY